jgi:hypothetical protein
VDHECDSLVCWVRVYVRVTLSFLSSYYLIWIYFGFGSGRRASYVAVEVKTISIQFQVYSDLNVMADKDLYDNPWPSNSQRPRSPTSTINTSTNPWRSRRASTSHSTTAGRRSYSPSLSLSSASSSFGELETDGLTGEGTRHGRAKRPVQYRQRGTIGGFPVVDLYLNNV